MRALPLLLLALPVLAWARPASACSCMPYDRSPRALRGMVAEYDLVFEGTVRSVTMDPAGDWKAAEFTVRRSWRGAPGADATIRTGPHAPACGIGFKPDTTYIVFASASKDGNFYAGSCGPTAVASGRVARALGDSQPGPGRGCTIAADPPGLWLLLLAVRRRRRGNQ